MRISEIFLDYIENKRFNFNNTVEVLKNPTRSEIKKLRANGIRIIVDLQKKNVYIFPSNSMALHDTVAKHIYGNNYKNELGKTLFFGFARDNGDIIDFRNSKGNKEKIKKVIKERGLKW